MSIKKSKYKYFLTNQMNKTNNNRFTTRNKQEIDSIAKKHSNQREYELQTHSTVALMVVVIRQL